MTNNLRRKNSRHRGSFTHGHGEKKKWRGAGHRGGRGNAGSGKRGDAKKPSYWKNEKMAGKFGFTNPTTKNSNPISITQINSSMNALVAKGVAKQEQDKITIDLSAANFDKLLGTGKPVAAYVITVAFATAGAIEKIKLAGGEVILKSSDVSSLDQEKEDNLDNNSAKQKANKQVSEKVAVSDVE
ncbi:uL15 family ribosomal protein [Candidatus Woesearchaeota archaeon]|nr:uL15 family ribosomal protein [Candidatus Woesearchaeota archaeon]